MEDRIFIWYEDNGDFYIWINNEFVGRHLDRALRNALYSKPISKEEDCWELGRYPKEKIIGLEDDELENLNDWVKTIPKITDEQWKLLFEEDWKSLLKTL